MDIMEEYRTIELLPDYEVSNLGNVRSKQGVTMRSNGKQFTRVSKVLKSADYKGYRIVGLCVNKKLITRKVHRLVAEAFLLNPENKETVNHKNGIKSDNRVENLEWATREENINHAIETGLFEKCHLTGSQIGNSKLKESDILEIRRKFKPHIYTKVDLGKEFGVSPATIKDILYGRSWVQVQ